LLLTGVDCADGVGILGAGGGCTFESRSRIGHS
jgi:hypothetical protein